MSGHKRTTIGLGDLEKVRFLELEERLRTVENDYERIFKKVKKDHAKEIDGLIETFKLEEQEVHNNLYHSLSKNTEGFEDVISGFQENFYTLINNQTMEFQQQIDEFGSVIQRQTSELVLSRSDHLMQTLDHCLALRDAEIHKISTSIFNEQVKRENYAIENYQYIVNYLNFVFDNYPIHRYYPNIKQQLLDAIAICQNNIEYGFYEASIASLQQLSNEIEKLRVEIKGKELRRKLMLVETKKSLSAFEQIVNSSSFVNAIGIDQEDLGIAIDVQFWSGNRYGEIVSRTNQLISYIQNSEIYHNEEELREIYDEVVPKLKLDLEESVYWARRNVLASQIRFNIASSVIRALGEQGFVLTRGQYEEGDQRGLYQVHLQHVDGSEVIVEVKEVEEDICSTQLDLESLDANIRSEHELKQRAFEVARSLQLYGLQVGKSQPTKHEKQYPVSMDPSFSKERTILEQRNEYGRN